MASTLWALAKTFGLAVVAGLVLGVSMSTFLITVVIGG